jgi:hypothetical protein
LTAGKSTGYIDLDKKPELKGAIELLEEAKRLGLPSAIEEVGAGDLQQWGGSAGLKRIRMQCVYVCVMLSNSLYSICLQASLPGCLWATSGGLVVFNVHLVPAVHPTLSVS